MRRRSSHHCERRRSGTTRRRNCLSYPSLPHFRLSCKGRSTFGLVLEVEMPGRRFDVAFFINMHSRRRTKVVTECPGPGEGWNARVVIENRTAGGNCWVVRGWETVIAAFPFPPIYKENGNGTLP